MAADKNGTAALQRFRKQPITVAEALHQSVPILQSAGIETPRLDSQLLLGWALGGAVREDLAREPERLLSGREQLMFEKAVALRSERRPLPYITGEAWFYGREFKVNRAVLIPRPETEMLVEFARETLETISDARIADVGTGSGCVAVTVACELPTAFVVAIDISPLALLIAAKNVRRHHVESRIELREGDLCRPLAGDALYDLIVSNPPYVPAADAPLLEPEVRDYEPALALYGSDGSAANSEFPSLLRRRLLAEGRSLLRRGGRIAVEIGIHQGEQAVIDAAAAGYAEVELREDFGGIPRILTGRNI